MQDEKRQNSPDDVRTRQCPQCGLEVREDVSVCPQDGTVLILPLDQQENLKHKYQFIRTIGSGGMGVIYQARQLILNKMVAVKMLHPHLVSPNALQRFQIEGRAAAALSHPHIVVVHDMGVTDAGLPYIVMDYVEGVTLAQWLEQKGCMPVERALKMFLQVCDALSHAHSRSVLHRDIKPGNIMLVQTAEGIEEARVMDFGIAKLIDEADFGLQHLTKTGESIGSPLYMSPEQARGERIDATSDIYSFGCVMFETLTGTPPFAGKTQMETMLMHINDEPPSLASRGRIFSPRLEEVVAKSLSKSPEARFQSMNELKNELVSLLGKSGRGLGRFIFVQQAQSRTKRWLMPVACLLLVFGAIWWNRPFLADQWCRLCLTLQKASEQRARQGAIERALGNDTHPVNLSVQALGFKLNDRDLPILQKHATIADLNLSATDVADAGLESLKNLKLTRLNLDGTDVHGLAGLESIPSLTDLSLSNTSVGHDGLRSIASLGNLHSLNLSQSSVSDADLQYLRGSPNLQNVNLSHCLHVTSGAVEALRKSLNPTCNLSYTNGYQYHLEAQKQFDEHNLPAAIQLSTAAQASFLSQRNFFQYRIAVYFCGTCFNALHRFKEAAAMYEDAIKNVQAFNPKSNVLADMYFQQGFAYDNASEYEKALQCHLKVAQLLKGFESNDLTVDNLLWLAQDYKSLTQYDRALQIALEARKHFNGAPPANRTAVAGALESVIAEIYRLKLEPEQALPHSIEALKLLDSVPSFKTSPTVFNAQSELLSDYAMLRRFGDAEKMIKDFLTQPAPNGWRRRQYEALIDNLTAQNKLDEAEHYKLELQKLPPQ